MEIITQTVTSLLLFATSFIGFGQTNLTVNNSNQAQPASVELGLKEVSPLGETGGFAIPASSCSDTHDNNCNPDGSDKPTINVDKPIIRPGEVVTVSWNPNGNVGCALSTTVTKLVASPNPSTAPNANSSGSRKDSPDAMTTYSIVCQGTSNSDWATVKVLMEIEET